MRRPAAFLDFQGTLGGGGTDDIASLNLYPFTAAAIELLNEGGLWVIGITNQSHISKGELSWELYESKLQQLKDELADKNAFF